MHLSLGTTMMAVGTTGLFLSLVSLCLINRNLLVRFGYRLLGLLIAFTALRFSLPFEFSFTKTVSLSKGISKFVSLCRQILFRIGEYDISFWIIFEFIWLTGAVCGIIRYGYSYVYARKYVTLHQKDLTDTAPYRELTERICLETHHRNCFQIFELPGLAIPMLFGIFSPKILLPEKAHFTDSQAYYILRHEMTHHFHHDLLLKCLIRLITIIYWWNPLCILLNRQTEVILEMHVDDSLTHSDAARTAEYMHCLVDYVSEVSQKAPLPRSITMGLFPKEDSNLVKRFYIMTNNQQKSTRFISVFICCLVFAIYLSSYFFIFEGRNLPTGMSIDAPLMDEDLNNIQILEYTNSYFIDNGDGTYDLYSNGMYLDTTDTTEGYDIGTPVYTPENNPYKDSADSH